MRATHGKNREAEEREKENQGAETARKTRCKIETNKLNRQLRRRMKRKKAACICMPRV